MRNAKNGRPKRAAKPPAEHAESRSLTVAPATGAGALDILRAIPEERVWLESQQSPQTRRAYRSDVVHFMQTMHITATVEFRKVDRMAVVAWKRKMEQDGAKPRSVRRRLAALSSLFSHLVDKHVVDTNPVREIRRPRVNRKQGTTLAFSSAQARKLLDAPDDTAIQGLRDRAILSVGLQAGPRRAEIAGLPTCGTEGSHPLRGFATTANVCREACPLPFSLPRSPGRLSAAVGELADRQDRIRTRVLERVGARRVRQASREVRRLSP
jgi:hypothetical protein